MLFDINKFNQRDFISLRWLFYLQGEFCDEFRITKGELLFHSNILYLKSSNITGDAVFKV